MGILPCKLGCPLLPYLETVGSSVGCPWAAHGNFAMQIKLPTTSIYGYSGHLSGQLSGQPTTVKSGNSGQFSGQPTKLPTIKVKMDAIFDSHARHLKHICI